MRIKDIVNRCNRALFFMRPYKEHEDGIQKVLDKYHRKGLVRDPTNPQSLTTFKKAQKVHVNAGSLYFENYRMVVDKEVSDVLIKLNYAHEVSVNTGFNLKYKNGNPVWISLTELGKECLYDVESSDWIFDGRLNRKKSRTYPRLHYRWLRSLSKGSTVACCYDGKWGRAVKGTVVKRNSSNIWVKFIPWAAEEKTEVVVKFTEGEGYNTGSSQMGLMYSMGCKGDFYRLSPLEGNPTPKNVYPVPLTYLVEGGSVKMARELKEAMEDDDVDY